MIQGMYFGENKNIEFKREIPKNHEKISIITLAMTNFRGD